MDLTMVEVLHGPGILMEEEYQKERGVKVHSAGVHIEHKMTAVQRKAWFFMLYNAVQASDEQDIYEVRIKDLADAIGCQATNLKRIKESLEGMVGITVKWDILEKCENMTRLIKKYGESLPYLLIVKSFLILEYANTLSVQN